MKQFIFFKQAPVFYVTIWWLVFLTLSLTNSNPFQLLNIIGFLFLIIVPGGLTAMSLRLRGLEFWGYAGLVVGFSLLELMLVGLLGNTILPFFSIDQPLEKIVLLWEIFFLVAVLLLINWIRWEDVTISFKRFIFFDNLRDTFLAFFPIVFVLLSIFGAIRLNNGGSNLLTMIMLGSMGLYIIISIKNIKKINKNVIPTVVFFISLSLLLMTSLRGWYLTGHDIQSEFRVFQLANNAHFWSPEAYRDSYNACMSITILPAIISELLRIPDIYIFKFLFQIIFALAPSVLYLAFNTWTNKTISYISVLYFVTFPTFFDDMPFLTRQEIAFLFYALMIYFVFEKKIKTYIGKILFLLFGVGMILSHYSTTYTVLFVSLIAIVLQFIFKIILKKINKYKIFKESALINKECKSRKRQKITLAMVLILFVLTYFWTSIITNTGQGFNDAFKQTYAAALNGFTENNRSIDAISMLSFKKPSQDQEFYDYISKHVNDVRKNADEDTYYDEELYSKYEMHALPDERTPLRRSGMFLKGIGIDMNSILTFFGLFLTKFLELLIPIGILYILFRNKIIKYINFEIFSISISYLFFIALNIVLPVLSVKYGLYRAMQQSMMILAPFLVFGSYALGIFYNYIVNKTRIVLFKIKYLKNNFEIFGKILIIVVFFQVTSFTYQLFGGSISLLYLDNSGRYYDNYLIKTAEVYGTSWIRNDSKINTNSAMGLALDVQTDRYSNNKLATYTSWNPDNDIFPGLIRKSSYVFLGSATSLKQRSTIIYNSDQVTYNYPVQFLDDSKDLIYNNGGSKVYK